MPLVFGDIVMVRIPDENRNPLDDPHPAMILYGPFNGLAIVIGITGTFDRPIPRLCIEMPWKDGGHPVTGLFKECIMVCSWIVQIDVSNVMFKMGTTPTGISSLAEQYATTHLLEKEKEVEAARTKAQSRASGA